MDDDTWYKHDAAFDAMLEALKPFACAGEDCQCTQLHYTLQQQSRCYHYIARAAITQAEKVE